MPRPPGVVVKSTSSALRDVVLPLPLSRPHDPVPVAVPCATGASASTGVALTMSPPTTPGEIDPVGVLLKLMSYAVHVYVCPPIAPDRVTDVRFTAAAGLVAKAPPESITVDAGFRSSDAWKPGRSSWKTR